MQLDGLLAFLNRHDRIPRWAIRSATGTWRAQGGALRDSRAARRHEHLDDAPFELSSIAAMIRRWIEGQTFAPRAGHSGVQARRTGGAVRRIDEVFSSGWKEMAERSSKSIFYPASLLSHLDWPDSRAMLAGERAAFRI